MRDATITVNHDGKQYEVTLNLAVQWEDDSFDHDWGGRRQTEECGHWELDWDETQIESVANEDGEEIDADAVPGLIDAIQEEAEGIDLSEWDE